MSSINFAHSFRYIFIVYIHFTCEICVFFILFVFIFLLGENSTSTDADLENLSISFPLHCGEYNQGCHGGYGFLAMKWSEEVGMIPSKCFPYDTQAKCPSTEAEKMKMRECVVEEAAESTQSKTASASSKKTGVLLL